MSHSHVKESGLDVHDTVLRLFDLGPKLMSLSAERSRAFTKDAASLLFAGLPKIHLGLPRCGCASCHIPETECPPRCVCEIEWDACRGEKLQATITVKNTSSTTQLFQFSSTQFQGPGNPGGSVGLTPIHAQLAPNQATTITVTFGVANNFQPGQTYNAEVTISGAYDQCVHVTLRVCEEKQPHCDVEQGDIPKRIRAHHWYDHFQCEEACFPPAHHPGRVVGTVDSTLTERQPEG